MKSSRIMMLMFAVMLAFSFVSFAQERIPREMFKGLDLTAAQKQKMDDLFKSRRDEEKKNFESIRAIQDQMDQEFLKGKPDNSKIRSYIDETKKIQGKLIDDHFNEVYSIKSILTDQQFKQFITNRHKMMERFMKNGRVKS